MKKIVYILLFAIFSTAFTYAEDIDDTSIIDELNKQEAKELQIDFNMKSFESCEGLESVMEKYVKSYWKNNKDRWGWYPMPMYRWMEVMVDDVAMDMEESAVSSKSVSWENFDGGLGGGWDEDFSETNVQVAWVDESDIVKTDGEYIYYYNQSDQYVYIVESDELEVVKKIKLPASFYSPVLYISDNRLVIVSSGYSNVNYSKYGYWFNRNAKTYTIVFDTTKKSMPVLTKLYVADGDLRKSRKIGDYVYVISNNNFSIPYYTFEAEDDISVDVKNIMPQKIDISKVSDSSKQNLKLRGRSLPYNITSGDVSACNEIEYVFPDEETLKEYDFAPSYNIISTINISDTSEGVKTKVIAGQNAEIYMSTDNLYMTSHMYQSYDFRCPANARCMVPWYPRGQNTLVHQISVDGDDLQYQNSNIVPGSPLNQYSMDQHEDKFRIITQTRYPELATNLYILNKSDLELHGMLGSIEPGEQFKSSRFIGDKLFLVTFKQVDPLFVISMSDGQNPKILWELKIPGYSTYLHPYDESHLIGLGYDTFENQWGGTRNGWVKVDLYEINYDKKCGDDNLTVAEEEKCESWDYKGIIVKQKYSKTWWDAWSYSEALNNPRMFMYKANDNKLFLPVTLYKNDEIEEYRHIDFYQWMLAMTVDKDNGIKENYRISHMDTSGIEEQRKEECMKYSWVDSEPKCVKLIDGSEYCESSSRRYVPKYCYADSPIWEYIASRNWNYRDSFIKRALWVWNNTYTISDDMMRSSNIDTGIKTDSVKIGK